MILFYAFIPLKFQPKEPTVRVQDDGKLSLDEVKVLWGSKNHEITNKLVSLKYKAVLVLLILTISCMSLLHLSANLQELKKTYSDKSTTWNNAIFVTFFVGINYNEQSGGDSYLYEMYGFIVILVFCIFERKSQIWLTTRFGYIGSKYDVLGTKFVLQRMVKTQKKKKKLDKASKVGGLDVIFEEKEDAKASSLQIDSQNHNKNKVFMEKVNSDVKEDKKHKDLEESLKNTFDDQRKNRIRDVVKLNLLVRISKGFRVFLYTVIILLSMLAAIEKSNVFGLIIMIAVIFMTFGKLTYFNLKWYSLFIMFIFFIQYLSALANLSHWNSPASIPYPFDDRSEKRPIRVPYYKELKKPFTQTATTEPYEGEIVPTKWSFYIGMMISSSRLEFLWFDWIIIILLYYFFVYFNSYAFEKDVEPITDDNIHKIVVKIEDQIGRNV